MTFLQISIVFIMFGIAKGKVDFGNRRLNGRPKAILPSFGRPDPNIFYGRGKIINIVFKIFIGEFYFAEKLRYIIILTK